MVLLKKYKNSKFYKGGTATTGSADKYVEQNVDRMNIKHNKVF